MVSGFEFAGWFVSGVGVVVKAAVGEGPAEPFVKEQKEQRDLDAFWREPVGVARAVALEEAVAPGLRRSKLLSLSRS
jgi:hypothetical protein